MKQILAILLLTCISYQYIAKMGVVVWYEANKDYIAQELCENKTKPELGCEGKCYLKKQLEKVEDNDQDKQQTPVKKNKTELPEFLSSATNLLISYQSDLRKKQYSIYKNLYRYTLTTSVFHPPTIC